jgi:multidrug resistance efflux pump
LSLAGAGLVWEVLATEGESVTEGQLLIRLSGQEEAEAAVKAAEHEALAARQAADQLEQDAPLETAQAWQAVLAAQQGVITAERTLAPYDLTEYQDELDKAREAVVETADELETAKEDFAQYEDWDEDNSTRKDYKERLDEAQRDYDEAVRVERELVLGKQQAEAELATAEAALDQAQQTYEKRQDGPEADELALAEARVGLAQAQLLAAQAALADLELRAPFAGVVCSVQARVGEWLIPGQTVLALADLAELQVETTDLNEIDAARIEAGYSAMVTFDALPEASVSGVVERVGLKAATGSGVNYTVVIRLKEIPAGLRWGMTAFVDIEVEE